MLKIRLQRIGRINSPAFRIIVAEHTRGPKAGNIVEKVGTYNPKTKERQLDTERIKYWISVGAQPSDTVHNMLITAGVTTGKKINVLPRKSPPKPVVAEGSGEARAGEAAPAVAAEAPAEPVAVAETQEVAVADTPASA